MTSQTQNKLQFRLAKSRAYKGMIILLACLITLPLFFIIGYIFKAGIQHINWSFLTHIPKPVGEVGGGIANALLGSLIIVSMAAVIAIPFGVLCGIYLSENKTTRLSYWSGLAVDILTGVPSIIMGIVIYFWIVRPMHRYSAFAGSIALAIMMLPIVVRSTEETLKLLPDSLKEAALALGIPYHRVILNVIVPCGFSGILSGCILAVARVAGETAPLLFTAFGNDYVSKDLFGPMASLPYLIFTYSTSAYQEWQNLAWGASLILLLWVLFLNIFTKVITRRWKIQL